MLFRFSMGELSGFSGRDVVKKLCRVGYVILRQRGSHVRLGMKGKQNVTVPLHKEIGIGLLLQILRETELTEEAFLQA
jgi:predicted RNA binding protein YcfA (HicA-like mRNA interferase family)